MTHKRCSKCKMFGRDVQCRNCTGIKRFLCLICWESYSELSKEKAQEWAEDAEREKAERQVEAVEDDYLLEP